jgi:hypothetical protein
MNRAILAGLVAGSMVGCGQQGPVVEIEDAPYALLVPGPYRAAMVCEVGGVRTKIVDRYCAIDANQVYAYHAKKCAGNIIRMNIVYVDRLEANGKGCTKKFTNISGDPHITTPDGSRFDHQPTGEFIYATDNRSFTIQVREEQWGGSRASVQTAVSYDMGSVKVGVYVREQPVLRINGAPAIVPCADRPVNLNGTLCDGRITLENDGWVTVQGSKISINHPDGEAHLDVWLNGTYINTQFFASTATSPNVAGIFGNFNNNPADDIQTREGVVLPQPVSFNDMYRKFADSWRIHGAESTFDYAQGMSTQSFTDLAFPGKPLSKADINPAELAKALDACKAAGVGAEHLDDCAMDAAIMGTDVAKDYQFPLRTLF